MRGPEQKPLASICTDPKTLSEDSIHKDILCLAIQFKNLPCRLFPLRQTSTLLSIAHKALNQMMLQAAH